MTCPTRHGDSADRAARRPGVCRCRHRIQLTFVLIGVCFVLMQGFVQAQPAGSTCISTSDLPITGARIVNIATEAQLQNAMSGLQAGDTLVLANGTYNLSRTLNVNGRSNVTIRGRSGCDGVVLVGRGMDNPSYGSVPHGVWSNSPNTTIAHLTVRDTYDNSIIFNAGARSPRVYSVRLLNAGSQFIKANPTDIAQGIGITTELWNTPGSNTLLDRPPRIMVPAWVIPTA